MRMRKKKHGAERMAACDEYIIKSPEDITELPVELEIGCGKGTFILETAKRNPNKHFVAVEKISDVLLLAAEKIKSEKIPNVKFMVCDAKNLAEIFPAESVSRIYLNFSDPWPKAGHYKRRLTYRGFLDIYKTILTEHGEIHFKTDNRGLFDFSLEELEARGFELHDITYDLHHSVWNDENIRTEYENNFSEKGFSINRVVAVKK